MIPIDVNNLPVESALFCRTAPVGVSEDGAAVYRNAAFQDKLISSLSPTLTTYSALYERAVSLYPYRTCLSFREFDYATGKSSSEFLTLSYAEVNKIRLELGSGILAALARHFPEEIKAHCEQYASYSPQKHSPIVSIFSSNRHEWILADLACHGYSLTNTALYDNLGDQVTLYILQQTKSPIIFTSGDHVRKLLSLKTKHNLNIKVIVSFDPISKLLVSQLNSAGVDYFHINELQAFGAKNWYSLCPPHKDTLFTVSFTSGTTGSKPKGVLLTHQNAVCAISFLLTRSPKIENGKTFIFLPLTHIYERQTSSFALVSGYNLGFPKISLDKSVTNAFDSLIEDLRVFKPHYVSLVPRILLRLESYIKNYVAKHPEREIIESEISKRNEEISVADYAQGQHSTSSAYNGLRLLVGFDNAVYTQTAAAPANRHTLKYLRASLNIGVAQMFGLTESFGACCRTIVYEAEPGSSGGLTPTVEAKLRDRPELDYTLADNKGELLLRGPQIFHGYYKDEEETRKAFDKDGWFITGDVAHIDNGKFYIIDRVKNFFKLAHGEYLSPERIENIYLTKNSLLEQLFLYGDPTRNYLVGIAGISFQGGSELLKQKFGNEKELLEEINRPGVKQKVLQLWNSKVKDSTNGIERMKNVHIEINPLTVERDVVTPTMKLKRPIAGRFFKPVIGILYDEEGILPSVSKL